MIVKFVFFAALATALPCLTPNATTPPDGRWLTSETLSYDSSGNGKTLAPVGTGAVTWNSSASGVGRGPGFANFDGTGGLQIANGNEPTNIDAQDFAVSFWIRLPDASKPCYRCPIVGQRLGCTGETHWVVWFRGDASYKIRFEMWNTFSAGLHILDADVDATLKDTQWHFVVAFREDTTLKLAVDGKVVNEKTVASVANLSQPRRPLAIGYWNQSCNGRDKDFFSGQLADVRLFVRKLPLCNAPATTTTSASQTTSVATTSASQTTSVATTSAPQTTSVATTSASQTTAPASVTTQTSVTGTTSVVPTQTTAPASDASTTGATTAQVSPTPSEPDSQIGAIVGGVVAALVLVAILVGVVLFHRRRRGDNANTKSETGSVTASTPYGSVLTALQ
jgi:hypothetical protein